MILEIDTGNSALKWRVVSAGREVLARGRSLLPVSNMFAELPVEFPCLQIVRVSCVASEDIQKMLNDAVFELWGVRSTFAATKKSFSGLKIAYEDPARLGVDRWLAMLAAFHEVAGPVCVFDCGSAITVDLVENGGVHRGGYIVPGLKMQHDALLNNTGKIRLEQAVEYQCHGWGTSTEEAVDFGVARMVASFIDAIVRELLVSKAAPRLFLTGGDAAFLLPLLERAELFESRPELVMSGLAIALP